MVMSQRRARVPVLALALAAAVLAGCAQEPSQRVRLAEGTPAAVASPEAETPVTLRFFHCAVEPLRLYGELWVVRDATFDEASKPADLSGNGAAVRDGDTLRYTDAAGGTLRFTRDEDGQPPGCD